MRKNVYFTLLLLLLAVLLCGCKNDTGIPGGGMTVPKNTAKTDPAETEQKGESGTMEAISEKGFNTPHLVDTKYETTDSVVALCDVCFFGAVGDGVTDDTQAFKTALKYAKRFGGTIFIPEGKYVIRESLSIPDGVCMRGERPVNDGTETVKGTVLLCYFGKNVTEFYNDTPFLDLGLDACLRDLSVYYPEQTLEGGKAVPYSWTIRQRFGSTVDNVCLINSYKGIHVNYQGTYFTNTYNVSGTPLKIGIYSDHIVDAARYENISFSADYWVNSGLDQAPSRSAVSDWLIKNAIAFQYERVDWTYFYDFCFDGYKIGMYQLATTSPSSEPGKAGGQIYHAEIVNCETCLWVQDLTWMGDLLTDCTFSAVGGNDPTAIRLEKGFDQYLGANGCTFASTGEAIQNRGSGTISLTNCRLSGGENAEAVVNMNGTGAFASVSCTYSGGKTHVLLGSSVRSGNLVNNMTADTFRVTDHTGGKVKVVYDNQPAPIKTSDSIRYDLRYPVKPATAKMINASEAPYNIKPAANGKGEDIAAVLQEALDDMKASGGGIVYLPEGTYRLDSAIFIPSGVELRGAHGDAAIHFDGFGTVFYTAYGKNKANGDPLIVLEEKSGVCGFAVFHDTQVPDRFIPFPYVIRGTGDSCYAVNLMLVNAYQGIDFASERCDNHYVSGITGTPCRTGIKVGGESKNGVVRDCHFNPTVWFGGGFNPKNGNDCGTNTNLWLPAAHNLTEGFVVDSTENEVLYANFIYGGWKGLVLRNEAHAYVLGFGADGIGTGIEVNNAADDRETWIVSSLLCVCHRISNEAYIKTANDFAGTLNIIQCSAFGTPDAGYSICGSGKVSLVGAYASDIYDKGIANIVIANKDALVIGCYTPYTGPSCDILIQRGASAVVYGNLFGGKSDRQNVKVASGATAQGGDIP